VGAYAQSVEMFGAERPLEGWEQRGVLVTGTGRVTRYSYPPPEFLPDIQGSWVLLAGYPFECWQQCRALVARGGRISIRLSGPLGAADACISVSGWLAPNARSKTAGENAAYLAVSMAGQTGRPPLSSAQCSPPGGPGYALDRQHAR
jgi:hypothetical protein